MRQIKFRAWEDYTKHMIVDLHLGDKRWPSNPHEWWKVMQYSGLKDKNGVEIYEGDIVRRGPELPAGVPLVNTYTIVFSKGSFLCKEMRGMAIGGVGIKFTASAYLEELEAIGNIYENPELMSGD